MKHHALLVCLLMLGLGCTAASLPEYEAVEGGSHLAFVCVDEETGSPMGPIDGCGCHVYDEAQGSFNTMGSVECLCVLPGGDAVPLLKTEPCGDVRCPTRGEDGDFEPALELDGGEQPQVCVPQGRGKLAALIASELNRSVSVMLVDQPNSVNRLLDASKTVPGQTSHFVDDVQVGVFSHSDGRSYFSVQGIRGQLAVFETAQTVLPDYELELGVGSISDAAVWHSDEGTSDMPVTPDALFVLDEARTTVYEFELSQIASDAVGTVLESRGCYTVVRDAADDRCAKLVDDVGGSDVLISDLTTDPDGRWLVMALGSRTSVVLFDRAGQDVPKLIHWDGQGDDCADGFMYEHVDGVCRNYSDCLEADVNGDGQLDQLDATCAELDAGWTLPECWDGADNDSDGLIDREDPGCDSILDRAELDREVGALCDNRLDDDQDGLTDNLDPGCFDEAIVSPFQYETLPECGDGIDNDGDGLIDFGGASPDDGCSHAADRSEVDAISGVGVRHIEALRAPRFGTSGWQLVAVDEFDGLHAALFKADGRVHLGDAPKADVQLIAGRNTTGRSDAIALDWDGVISMWSFGRKEALTVQGFPLFGARPAHAEASSTLWSRIQLGYGGGYDFLYRVEDGTALSHNGLTGQCSPNVCTSDSDCPAGGECLEGVCVASQCGETQCPDGAQCRGNVCLAQCDQTQGCALGQVCELGYCMNPCAETSDGDHMYRGEIITLDDSAWFEAQTLFNKGANDPAMYVRAASVGEYEEVGRDLTSASATTQLTGAPTYSVDGRAQAFDPNGSLFFCDLDPSIDDAGSGSAACVPAGYLEEFGSFRRLSLSERDAMHPATLTSFDEIQLAQDYFSELDRTTDFYTLKFEGTLPASRSKHGRYAGLTDGGWLLADPKVNFCDTGVQIGDVVLIDRLRVRSDASNADCAPWTTPDLDGPPEQRLEPLRYRVAGVGVRSLSLAQDSRTTYHQLPRTATQDSPHPAVALGPPPPECVSDGFTYEVRVADDFWLVESGARGYQHPWRSDGASCRVDGRDRAASRFQIGDVYDDGLVRFSLGQPSSVEMCDGEPCRTYMIGTVISFGVSNRALGKPGGITIGAVSDMAWSVFDDRLYVLDVAGQTVIQVGGLSSASLRYIETNRLQ
jgi:hypothetical protein